MSYFTKNFYQLMNEWILDLSDIRDIFCKHWSLMEGGYELWPLIHIFLHGMMHRSQPVLCGHIP